jgi:hypothetical protein
MSGIGSAAKSATRPIQEIHDELHKEGESPEEIVAELDDPKLKEEYTFELNYVDGRGRTYKGTFTNRILNLDQISEVGVLRAIKCGNIPLIALDVTTVDTAERLAHCTVSLVKRPKWAADLGKLRDPEILHLLYKEVSSHEDTFLGRGQDQEAGPGGEGDTDGEAP